MSTADGMDNPAFASEEECTTETKLEDSQQQVTLDQDRKADGDPVENGHQRTQFASQQHTEPGRTSPGSHYRTETKIELPESNDKKTAVEPKMNGVHGNGNNNDASFLNNSVTSVQINDTGKKEQIEAVNLELVSMRPYAGNNLQTKGQEACEVPADPYEEYFVPVNEHRKYIRGPEAEVETTVAGVRFDLGPGVGREGLSLRDPAAGLVDYSHWLTALRGEKLYVTKDKRSRSSYWRRMACWGCGLLVLLIAVIIAILAATGVILTQEASEPLENLQQTNSRQFGDVRTAGSQEYVKDPPPSPPPATSSFLPWPTTDETLYNTVPSALDGVLKLDELRWTEDLNDPKSRVYRQVSSEIEEYLKNMLHSPTDNETIVKVYDINKNGEVKFRISYPPISTPDEMQNMIEETLQKSGSTIGRYHLNNLKLNKLLDECQSKDLGCSEGCKYDYSKGLFVCSCGTGKVLDKDGKRCNDENDLSNVEMEDVMPESKTEVVHDYVQGRSRGPGTVFEPRRPDNWDHLGVSTEETTKEHDFHAPQHSEHDSSSDPESIERVNEESDSMDWMHDHSGDGHSMHDHSGHDHSMHDHSEYDHSMHDYPNYFTTEPKSEPEPTSEPEPSGKPEPSIEYDAAAKLEPAAEPESSAVPEPAAKPEPSAAPEPAAEPEPSAELEPVAKTESAGEREPAVEAEATAKLEPSAEPEPAAEPEPSVALEPTVEPEPSATPEPAAEPEPSAAPEPTAEPEPSAAPEPAAKPEPSAAPEPTAKPEPSAAPEPTAKIEPSVKLESAIDTIPPVIPESSTESEPSLEPKPSMESAPSAEPAPSAELEPSAEPEPSAKPEPSAELNPITEPVISAEPQPTQSSSDETKSSTGLSMETKPSAKPVLLSDPEPSTEPKVPFKSGLATESKTALETEFVTKPPETTEYSELQQQPNFTTRPEAPSETGSSTENESTSPVSVDVGRQFPADANMHRDMSVDGVYPTEMQDSTKPQDSTEQMVASKTSTDAVTINNNVSVEGVTLLPDIIKTSESSIASSTTKSMIEYDSTNVFNAPAGMEQGYTTPVMPVQTTLPSNENFIEESSNDNAPLPVIPLMSDSESPMTSDNSFVEDRTEPSVTVIATTMAQETDEEKITTMSSIDMDNQMIPKGNQVIETNTSRDEIPNFTTMNTNIEESTTINASSESPFITESSVSEESTLIPETTPTAMSSTPITTTELNATIEIGDPKTNNAFSEHKEEPRGNNMPISNDSSPIQPESITNEHNETNIIEHMPTTVFPKLPKNFGHNVEPLIEPFQNSTEEEHIMIIPQVEHTTARDPHAIIPQLIPEQSIQPANASSTMITEKEASSATTHKVSSTTESVDTSPHHSTIHPEENIVSLGDAIRYEDNLDHSTSHPLHPAVFPENTVEHATERNDGAYDKHLDDMSPFLPDVQKEKEVKKAPRLDKDEQDVPNPFEGHVEDVVTDKPLIEITSTERQVNVSDLEDYLNDVHPEVHDVKTSEEQTKESQTGVASDTGRGFKTEVNETDNGLQNGLHGYDVVENKASKSDELNGNGSDDEKKEEEEDEEALKVVPLEEQFKEAETTVKYNADKDNPETTIEPSMIMMMPEEKKGTQLKESTMESNVTMTTSEKPEENAVEDQYNDIIEDTIVKGYQHNDSELRKKFKDESNKLIVNDLDSSPGDDKKSIKSTDIPPHVNKAMNDTEVTTIASDKRIEDAKLTTEIPVLPLEIQQEMSTTEKIDSTTVSEENLRKENETGVHSTTVRGNLGEVTITRISSMDSKTTAQVPILPEELQTTESDSLLTTSTMKPDNEIRTNNSEGMHADSVQSDKIDFSKPMINNDTSNNNNNNKTIDVLGTTAVPQINIHNETADDLVTDAVEHILSKSLNNTESEASILSNINNVNTSETGARLEATNNSEELANGSSASSSEVMTTAESKKPILNTSSTTEDVRPVTEILEDDTEPIGFDYRTHFITTTPKMTLTDLDVGEFSEEDLRVIPLEKSLEVKKKSVDKKLIDKYKYKKEKELNLEEGENENISTEIPEAPTMVHSTDAPQIEMKANESQINQDNHNDTILTSPEENSAPLPQLKIIEMTSKSNHTVQNDTSLDTTKKYPSFIPVSEEIIEPESVTKPFIVIRQLYNRRPNTEFATENPMIVEETSDKVETAIESEQTTEMYHGKVNETGLQGTATTFQPSIGSTTPEAVVVNQVAKDQTLFNVQTTIPPTMQTKLPSPTLESTSHIDVSFLNLPPNVFFSKCTAGQFQCANGTSRDGAYCVQLSAKCDSENDCSDGSDEWNCEDEGCPGNFQCASGQCLKRDLVCNKIVDCDDGSDERNCDEWKCQFDEFRCPNGRCIPGIWQCNGRPDCEDHRDEYNCAESCGNNEYLCPTEKWCIPLTWHCNGINECANGEDEKLCDCALDQFKCQTGGCVPENQVCDGIEHCPDQSDEWGCLLTNVTTDVQKEDDGIGTQELVGRSSLLKIRQYNGEYRLICSDGWSEEFSDSYCQALGFAGSESTELQTWDKTEKILRLKSNPNHRAALVVNLEQVEFCVSDKVVRVSCQEFSCGSHYGEGPTARLVGGTPASEGQWSSVALLKEQKQGAACTASVLGPMHVLVSYSCVHRFKQSNGWQLFTGENLLKAHPVKHIIPYPQVKYNQFLYNNDIALVELEKPLAFSRNVSAVCLPKNPIQPRQICVTVGWGFSGNGEVDLQKYLNFLPLPTFDSEKCNATSHYAGFITKDNICAGFTDTDKGPCYNDEGAPLMCVSESGGGSAKWEIQGLLSHHSRCSRGHPAIYSSVEPALSWLRYSVPALQAQS